MRGDLTSKIAALSPEQRQLFEARVREAGLSSLTAQAIPGRPAADSCPLSFEQEHLWVFHQLEPAGATHNLATRYPLHGPIQVAALEQSVNQIVARHEILRTNIVVADGRPAQKVAPALTVPLRVVDLRAVPESERLPEARRLATAAARVPFDLAADPLLRITLLRLDAERHDLLVIMHHIVTDRWSLRQFVKELLVVYRAVCDGAPAQLPRLPIQYADYAVWQRQWLRGPVLDDLLTYWKRQLDGAPMVLALPTDRPRSRARTFEGAKHPVMLPQRLTAALEALARKEGATLFMTLLAAFATLLHRHSAQDDLLVGTPSANRSRSGTERLIGFLLNMLLLRIDLSRDPSFRELMARVRGTTLGAYAHQHLPFGKLVEALRPTRSPGRNPLLQAVFTFPQEQEESRFARLVSGVDTGTQEFDLTLALWRGPTGLTGHCGYKTDLFDAATIQRLMGHYRVLLEGIVADPSRRLSELPLVTAAERDQLLVRWNDTRMDHSQEPCVHQLFEAQALLDPEATAVVCGSRSLTYGDLDRRSNQLARYLIKRGVGPEVRVGICCERSLELIIGLLAVLKAGGAYVPMHPAATGQRLTSVLEETEPRVLLTQVKLAKNLRDQRVQLLCLDADWPVIARESETAVENAVLDDNLAYVIYTSGSTGRPKGVAIPHRGLRNLVCWHRRAFHVTRSDRTTQLAATEFDASVWELWPCLASGGSVHFAPQATRADPARLRDWLVEQGITVSFLPTPLAERLLALEWPRDLALKTLLVGGDRLHRPPPDLPFEVVNHYGPTENTVVTTSGPVRSNQRPDLAPTIGRPIDNVTTYLLDSALQPVPIGVPGELYIGGTGLGRGYLERPDLTAAAFLPDPFSSAPGARMYRTGDCLRHRADGSLDFLGRNDAQVKIRGFRVEPGEIEAVLSRHPACQQVVVLALGDEASAKRLVAFIVRHPRRTASEEELRDYLEAELPDYMVPQSLLFLDAMPLTAHGKVDRRALPIPSPRRPESRVPFVAPSTPLEQHVAEIWQRLLGVDRVGVRDNFFDLGGHSLLLVDVHRELQELGSGDLRVTDLLRFPTLGTLARWLGRPQHERDMRADRRAIDGRASRQRVAIHHRQRLMKEVQDRDGRPGNRRVR